MFSDILFGYRTNDGVQMNYEPSRKTDHVAWLIVAVLMLAMITNSATACFVCVVPYKSLLDKVEECEQVVVARTIDQQDSEWQIVRVIKAQGDFDFSQIDSNKNSYQPMLGELQLLRRTTANDFWTHEGTIDAELYQFLAGAVALSSGPLASARQQSMALCYFLPHLEHKYPQIADSAYNRIARAPYRVIQQLGADLNPDQLLAWINDQRIPQQRRSLYITLLGFCGRERELHLLKQWIDWRWENGNSGDLAVLLTAHAELNGEETIRFIEQSYLQNHDRTLDELIKAVDALRVHGQADGTIPRSRILASFHLLLKERPQLLELIIEDCARWEQWSFAPRFMEIYASGKQPWNNAMIIKYLEACPMPEAKSFTQSFP